MNKKEKRISRILELLKENGRMRVADLARLLDVTPETLRTDLTGLAASHLVEREHGQVRLINRGWEEEPYIVRNTRNVPQKYAASYAALSKVKDGQVIYVDGGTTVMQGLEALRGKKDLTVVTNSLTGAMILSDMDINTIMVGGTISNQNKYAYGAFTTLVLDHIQFDTVFISTDGFKDCGGFTTRSEMDMETKRQLMARTECLVVISDSSKFGFRAAFRYCSFREVDALYTNRLSDEQREQVQAVRQIIEI